MSITIEIQPETEERLRLGANAAGVSIDVYAADLLEKIALQMVTPQQKVRRLNAFLGSLPRSGVEIKPEDLSRAALYGDATAL